MATVCSTVAPRLSALADERLASSSVLTASSRKTFPGARAPLGLSSCLVFRLHPRWLWWWYRHLCNSNRRSQRFHKFTIALSDFGTALNDFATALRLYLLRPYVFPVALQCFLMLPLHSKNCWCWSHYYALDSNFPGMLSYWAEQSQSRIAFDWCSGFTLVLQFNCRWMCHVSVLSIGNNIQHYLWKLRCLHSRGRGFQGSTIPKSCFLS